jgi:hypothetical protein
MNSFAIRPFDAKLASQLRSEHDSVVYIADEFPGYPCRQCLRDAKVGEELLLVSFDPFNLASPYRSASPIFIHRKTRIGDQDTSEIPEQLGRRHLSVRAFDGHEMMIDAKVIQGVDLAELLSIMFAQADTSYVDIHNASRGCWAARVDRIAAAGSEN